MGISSMHNPWIAHIEEENIPDGVQHSPNSTEHGFTSYTPEFIIGALRHLLPRCIRCELATPHPNRVQPPTLMSDIPPSATFRLGSVVTKGTNPELRAICRMVSSLSFSHCVSSVSKPILNRCHAADSNRISFIARRSGIGRLRNLSAVSMHDLQAPSQNGMMLRSDRWIHNRPIKIAERLLLTFPTVTLHKSSPSIFSQSCC